MTFDHPVRRKQPAGPRNTRGVVYGSRQRRLTGGPPAPVKYEEMEDYEDVQDPNLEDGDLDYNMEYVRICVFGEAYYSSILPEHEKYQARQVIDGLRD